MKVKTQDLTGAALDWAVAVAEGWSGWDSSDSDIGYLIFTSRNGVFDYLEFSEYSPSTDWSLGGPLMEIERIELRDNGDHWQASMHGASGRIYERGLTRLVAAMRCYVAFSLGDEVEIPAELTQETP